MKLGECKETDCICYSYVVCRSIVFGHPSCFCTSDRCVCALIAYIKGRRKLVKRRKKKEKCVKCHSRVKANHQAELREEEELDRLNKRALIPCAFYLPDLLINTTSKCPRRRRARSD